MGDDPVIVESQTPADAEAVAEEEEAQAEAARALEAEDEEDRTDDRKARKRQEAETRQRVYKATRSLRAELDEVEAAVASTEARLKAIDDELTLPETHARVGRVPALILERRELEATLARTMDRWEALSLSLEEATARAQTE